MEKSCLFIDPSLPVAQSGSRRDGRWIHCWPSYYHMTSDCRATYLDWLMSGRSDPSYDFGNMLLYFYGIERRFLIDRPTHEEKVELLQEVRRLMGIYPDDPSVRRVLEAFIQIAEIQTSRVRDLSPIFEKQVRGMPLSLKVALGTHIDKGKALGADWLLSWLTCHGEYNSRMPATRCPEEFRALFRLRFEKRYPDGMKVRRPRSNLSVHYRAASGEFEGIFRPKVKGRRVPDISYLSEPVHVVQKIADEVAADLDRYSRYLGRNPDGRGSFEAHALLPIELWPLFSSDKIDEVRTWASAVVNGGGLTPAVDLVARFLGKRPEKIGERQLTDAADALARIGFGLAPDPRYALRIPRPEEPVVLFELGEQVEKFESVSPAYRSALMQVALATFVARSDGQITDIERRSLFERVETADVINERERRLLRANLAWFLNVSPDLSLLRRRLKDFGPAHHVAMRRALMMAAHADGGIGSEEVASMEAIYKALSMDPALVYSDLHAGDIDNGPRIVQAARRGARGEAIPDDGARSALALDTARIAAIRSDTERVSSVLGQIFAETEDSDDARGDNEHSVFKGLDSRHAIMVRELIELEHWTEESFRQLCSRHELLPSGTLEALNEWAFDVYDEALLEEYDGYEISTEIAAALKSALETGGHHVWIETA